MATTETFVHGRLYEMPLSDLQPDPNQPRKYIDPAALDELTESIKQQGVVTPILFRVESDIAYVIEEDKKACEVTLVSVNGLWATFGIGDETEFSEPLDKLTLSWDDSGKGLKFS